jgi:hypothetical protein
MATKKKNLKKSAKATAKAPTGTATANPQAAPAQAQARAPQPDPTALSIGDLKNLSTVLDVASTRGAFKANEMAGVGFLYNKLQAFLAKVAPEQKPEGTPTVGQAEAGQAPAPTQEK